MAEQNNEEKDKQESTQNDSSTPTWKEKFVLIIGFIVTVAFIWYAFKAMVFSPSKPSDLFEENSEHSLFERDWLDGTSD